ncbi:hypothetical protein DF3PB_1080002 [uncultured Defluviicoccus sp.]|uniref:Uncharacterized protein n=1 Tax=metagenome TaxID=256318 RepID=A0A380T923_9ZZZZ|nr:hypothetical protein DF3PB_1080002 [uncultured Defluviicoccus sp.]
MGRLHPMRATARRQEPINRRSCLLLFPERVEGDHLPCRLRFATSSRGLGGCPAVLGRWCRRFFSQVPRVGVALAQRRAQLQAEVHRRIAERGHRCKRNLEPIRPALELERYRERILLHHQVPELVLQDNGHLAWIPRPYLGRHLNVGRRGCEADVEVMLAGQPVLGRVRKGAPDDPAQTFVEPLLVGEGLSWHRVSVLCWPPSDKLPQGSGRLLVPGASRTPLTP